MSITFPRREYSLGTVEASEQLIQDLYLDLRRRTRFWANITFQTAQARMGYVGQHLVSIVTGCQGGRSGARGHDLLHQDGTPGEIKTCYRVDQLGKCRACKAGVSPDEEECADCGSDQIDRKDDSKWLISFRHDEEFSAMLSPSRYYLVLFEFTDLQVRDVIRASIWAVDPRCPGFALAMTDYYLNIRAASKSKAPFNLWPYSLKFEMMRPQLIYRSLIHTDDRIETVIFPGRDQPQPTFLRDMTAYKKARVTREKWAAVRTKLEHHGAVFGAHSSSKEAILKQLQMARTEVGLNEIELTDLVATVFYADLLAPHTGILSGDVRDRVFEILHIATEEE